MIQMRNIGMAGWFVIGACVTAAAPAQGDFDCIFDYEYKLERVALRIDGADSSAATTWIREATMYTTNPAPSEIAWLHLNAISDGTSLLVSHEDSYAESR